MRGIDPRESFRFFLIIHIVYQKILAPVAVVAMPSPHPKRDPAHITLVGKGHVGPVKWFVIKFKLVKQNTSLNIPWGSIVWNLAALSRRSQFGLCEKLGFDNAQLSPSKELVVGTSIGAINQN